MIYHPVTIARDTVREADELLAALQPLSQKLLFISPNPDCGSRELLQRIQRFIASRPDDRFITNVEHDAYLSLLQFLTALVGNSSSGIMEAASFKLPVVDVGMRQKGRERGPNVLDCPAERGKIEEAIQAALSDPFRSSLGELRNPYGDGHSSEKIAEILSELSLSESLLVKAPVPIRESSTT